EHEGAARAEHAHVGVFSPHAVEERLTPGAVSARDGVADPLLDAPLARAALAAALLAALAAAGAAMPASLREAARQLSVSAVQINRPHPHLEPLGARVVDEGRVGPLEVDVAAGPALGERGAGELLDRRAVALEPPRARERLVLEVEAEAERPELEPLARDALAHAALELARDVEGAFLDGLVHLSRRRAARRAPSTSRPWGSWAWCRRRAAPRAGARSGARGRARRRSRRRARSPSGSACRGPWRGP